MFIYSWIFCIDSEYLQAVFFDSTGGFPSSEFCLARPFPELLTVVSDCLLDKGWLCPPLDNLHSILATGGDNST